MATPEVPGAPWPAETPPWPAGLHDRAVRHRPDVRTVLVPGAGHLVHLDQPTAFTAAVRQAVGAAGV